MRMWILAILSMLIIAFQAFGQGTGDWRIDLLKQEGIGLDQASLKKALGASKEVSPEWEKNFQQLGSTSFSLRQKAQDQLASGGEAALEWLQHKELPQDPEIMIRLEELIERLESRYRQARDTARDHAIRTLLADGSTRAGKTGGRFFEWFGTDAKTLDGGYRKFEFQDQVDRGGRVERGFLILPGDKVIDGDQRLILKSQAWPEAEEFGGSFEVSVSLGADSNQGSGAWHIGLSIGNIKILFHPELAGGAFRFERASDRHFLCVNEDMGFTPKGGEMQWMSVKVSRLIDGRVQLVAIVGEGRKREEHFERKIIVSKDDIGNLSEISLLRSGRIGAAARFQNFEISLTEGG